MNKSLQSAIAIYGILKAGAAYVPLDPSTPVARLSTMINHCGIRCLVSSDGKRNQVTSLLEISNDVRCVIGVSDGILVHCRSVSWDAVDLAPAVDQGRVVPDDIAYIMYTSGSTGLPKGVTHTHASGYSYARAITGLYGIQPNDIFGNHSPLHFDISLFDFLGAPLCGATVVIVPESHTKLPASLSQLIDDENVTIWFSAPNALTQLLLHGVLDRRDLSALRWVIFGGEPFPPKYLSALMRQVPNARFSNSYGPAEVNMCAYHHVDAPVSDTSISLPIGHVWPISESLIVDHDDNPVGEGEPGELLIRSKTCMQGYWRAPELNAMCFYHRTAADGTVDKFYRTGDIVKQGGSEGMLFLGRKDRQIKIRGFRIELDEIEAILCEHPAVEEAGSFTVDGANQIEVAVTVTKENSVESKELLAHCTKFLPQYAVPADIHVIESFPSTSSQKIDRRALARRFDQAE